VLNLAEESKDSIIKVYKDEMSYQFNSEGGAVHLRGSDNTVFIYFEEVEFKNCHSAKGGALNLEGVMPVRVRGGVFHQTDKQTDWHTYIKGYYSYYKYSLEDMINDGKYEEIESAIGNPVGQIYIGQTSYGSDGEKEFRGTTILDK